MWITIWNIIFSCTFFIFICLSESILSTPPLSATVGNFYFLIRLLLVFAALLKRDFNRILAVAFKKVRWLATKFLINFGLLNNGQLSIFYFIHMALTLKCECQSTPFLQVLDRLYFAFCLCTSCAFNLTSFYGFIFRL